MHWRLRCRIDPDIHLSVARRQLLGVEAYARHTSSAKVPIAKPRI
jgi:hypothetical protein